MIQEVSGEVPVTVHVSVGLSVVVVTMLAAPGEQGVTVHTWDPGLRAGGAEEHSEVCLVGVGSDSEDGGWGEVGVCYWYLYATWNNSCSDMDYGP